MVTGLRNNEKSGFFKALKLLFVNTADTLSTPLSIFLLTS